MPPRLHAVDISALSELVGREFGPSRWVEVDEERIRAFAAATDDRQWIHVDAERARRELPLGRTIAHGYLTLSLAPVLLAELLEVGACSRIVNYGIDKLRLKEPVPAGSRLRLAGSILGVRSVPRGAARLSMGLRWELEGAARPACTAEVVYVYYP
jgi:acyl dehydratase